MTSNVVTEYNRQLREIADQYSTEGYNVLTQPLKDELPPFLRHFHPDLIAVRPDQSVIVEVKAPGKVRRTDYWRELADAVKSHQEWKLVIADSTAQEAAVDSMSPSEVEDRLNQSTRLAEAGEAQASFLMAWSAAEAAMRLIAEQYNVKVFDLSPRSLMSRLVSEGLMDRQDYDVLTARIQQRDAVAHGFRQGITEEDLQQLRAVVQNLLTELEEE